MAQKTGIVTVSLDGDEVELHCTPGALGELCVAYGDLRTVQQHIGSLDFNAMVTLVMIAAPAAKSLKRDAVQAAVFEAGIVTLVTPLMDYITLLANGGKPIDGGGSSEGASKNV